MVFNGRGIYRGENQTMGDLARMVSNQLAKPVDDHTGLAGRYDFSLNWSDDSSPSAGHSSGGGDHGDRGGASAGGAALTSDFASSPTLFGALQAQLGLRLEKKKASANVFVVDRVTASRTPN